MGQRELREALFKWHVSNEDNSMDQGRQVVEATSTVSTCTLIKMTYIQCYQNSYQPALRGSCQN